MRIVLAACLACAAAPVFAEHVEFDHRLHPALSAMVLRGDEDAILFEDARPDHLLDRMLIRGRSQQDWDEVMEILVRPRPRRITDPQAWLAAFRQSEDVSCPSDWGVISHDATSITFSRGSARCAALAGQQRIYRAVLGQREVFLLGGFVRGEMEQTDRQHWLAVLASAHLAG